MFIFFLITATSVWRDNNNPHCGNFIKESATLGGFFEWPDAHTQVTITMFVSTDLSETVKMITIYSNGSVNAEILR